MTIKRGDGWGEPAEDRGPMPAAADDAELAAMVWRALADDTHLTVGVERGDLLATLGLAGGGADRHRHAYPMDLGLARFGRSTGAEGGSTRTSETVPFAAHVTVHRPSRLGRLLGHGDGITVAVLNAAWLGDLRLGPRAHPNDGLLDITIGQVPFRERREARRRARTGSHLPHPALTVQRTEAWHVDFGATRPIRVDGVDRGRADRLAVEVIPDAYTVVA